MQLFSNTVRFVATSLQSPVPVARAADAKAPRVLDLQALKRVSGGGGETPAPGPRKFW